MTDTADSLALLRAVCEFPDEDTPRLMYADYLEERGGTVACECYGGLKKLISAPVWQTCSACHGSGQVPDGNAARAELIRVQVELADVGRCRYARSTGRTPRCHGPTWCGECRKVGGWDRAEELRRRERELLDGYGTAAGITQRNEWLWAVPISHLGSAARWKFRRGFIEALTCTAADWLAHADKWAWHPGQTWECRTGILGDDSKITHGGCPVCHGRGHFTRPCPPTAQPVREVTLTNWPVLGLYSPRGRGWRVEGYDKIIPWDAGNRVGPTGGPEHIRALLETEWDWLTFHLPP